MKLRVWIAIAAGACLLGTAADAESYYVRNRPFTSVVKVGGEALVGAEAFLRALGVGWNLDGNVVQVVNSGGSNPPLSGGNLTFTYAGQSLQLEASPRGNQSYVSLRPLARLLNYSVQANRATGTVDVIKARFATAEELKLAGSVSTQREEEQKAAAEAWAKKAAELKARREAKEAEPKEGAEAGATPAEGKAGETTAATPAEGKAGETTAATPEKPPEDDESKKKLEEYEKRLKELEKAPPKKPQLEVFRADANPDYSSGVVTVECEVRNVGDAPSKATVAQMVLKGPDQARSASDTLTVRDPRRSPAPTSLGTKVYLRKSVSTPAIAPGASHKFSERYVYPGGSSIPIGNFTVEVDVPREPK